MIAKINNIVLEKDRFMVFYTIDTFEETFTFMPEVTAPEIINFIKERKAYYESLEVKEDALKDELLNIEI